MTIATTQSSSISSARSSRAYARQAYRQSLASMAAALGAPVEEFSRLWNEETAQQRVIGALKSPEENIEYIRVKLTCRRIWTASWKPSGSAWFLLRQPCPPDEPIRTLNRRGRPGIASA